MREKIWNFDFSRKKILLSNDLPARIRQFWRGCRNPVLTNAKSFSDEIFKIFNFSKNKVLLTGMLNNFFLKKTEIIELLYYLDYYFIIFQIPLKPPLDKKNEISTTLLRTFLPKFRKLFPHDLRNVSKKTSFKSFSSQSLKKQTKSFNQLGKTLKSFSGQTKRSFHSFAKISYAKLFPPKFRSFLTRKPKKKQQREYYSKKKRFPRKLMLTHRMQFWNRVETSSRKFCKKSLWNPWMKTWN